MHKNNSLLKTTIDEFINSNPELSTAKAVLGIGSYFQGTNNDDSDVDLVVVIDTKFLVKKSIMFKGVHFDVTFLSLAGLRHQFEDSNNRLHWKESLRNSIIIKDFDNSVLSVLEVLKKFENKSFTYTELDIRFVKGMISNYCRKISVDCFYLYSCYYPEWMRACYKLLCMESGRAPLIQPSLQIIDIRENFLTFYEVLESIENENSTNGKQKAVVDFTNELLATKFSQVSKYGLIKKQLLKLKI